MTAIAWGRTEIDAGKQGAQPFDARHHLRDVAELISVVFAEDLDASGHGALEEMQWVSRLSPLLGGLLSTTFFSEFVLGYVWVEAGRVVGNVTFQRSDLTGSRWRISNVAVAPDFRRRGIARSLMQATLADIALRDGHWAVLQVRADNPSARQLYVDLGFKDVCIDGVWELPPARLRTATASAGARSEGRQDALSPLGLLRWRDRFELARVARSSLAQWAYPVNPGDYQPGAGELIVEALGRLTGLRAFRRWGAWDSTRLVGAVEVVVGSGLNPHQLRFETAPDARDHWELALLAKGLSLLAALPPRPVYVEHNGDDADYMGMLETLGFRPQRVLLTMRRLMTAADLGF